MGQWKRYDYSPSHCGITTAAGAATTVFYDKRLLLVAHIAFNESEDRTPLANLNVNSSFIIREYAIRFHVRLMCTLMGPIVRSLDPSDLLFF
jgi:hypothetical protein